MRRRLFLLCLAGLLGVVSAFFVRSLWSALDGRRALTFGMSGPVVVLDVRPVPGETPRAETGQPGSQERAAGSALASFLRQERLTLVAQHRSEGAPVIRVEDAAGRLPWLTSAARGDLESDLRRVLLVGGSYSEQAWERGRQHPLLPAGSVVAGVVSAPPRSRPGMEYLASVRGHALAPGTYALSSLDSRQRGRLEQILAGSGLEIGTAEQIPLAVDLRRNPLVVVTTVLTTLGCACLGLLWHVEMARRRAERRVRSWCGATPRALLAQDLAQAAPWLVAGATGGALGSALLVAAVSAVPVELGTWRACAAAAVIASLLALLTRGVVVAGSLWRRGGER